MISLEILLVHPLWSAMGGGDRLCCETIRSLKLQGHELVLLSGDFHPDRVERFFGYDGIFHDVVIRTYPYDPRERFGSYKHLLHHIRAQKRILSQESDYDVVLSTQDAGYIPDVRNPVLQWGYFPNLLSNGLYAWPMRRHYSWKIKRIALVLAISGYSKARFDQTWRVPTRLVYPACNMVRPSHVRDNIVVTAARGVPEKRLQLFWEVARHCPNYRFVLLLTVDPRFEELAKSLQETVPANGRVIVNHIKAIYDEVLSRSRIYLHLMNGEHFGITVVEAMSAGCVPVVHASGGPREIVGDSGLLWRRVEEIPRLLAAADAAYESLSERSMERARNFSQEKFDVRLGEALEEKVSRLP